MKAAEAHHRVFLADVIAKRTGSVDPSKFPDETFELLSIPAFDAGKPEILRGSEIGSSKQIVQEGDVLLSKIVPHIRRSWVVRPQTDHRLIASGEWIVFRSEDFDAGYLRHLLVSNVFHSEFMRTVSGVGGSLLRARPSEVAKISIPQPSLEEQKRIAAILDKADSLRCKRQQAIRLADDFLRAVFLDMFGDPESNPKHWPTTRLDEISLQITDGEHQTPQRSNEGIYLLSARNVQDGRLDFGDVDYVPHAEYERIRKRCEPVRGDVLISCSGSIGRVAQVDVDVPLTLVRSVALVRPDPTKVRSGFLEHLLRTPSLQRAMQKASKSSAQANLFQAPIRTLTAILPPISLQDNFEQVRLSTLKARKKIAESSDEHQAFCAAIQNTYF